MKRCACPPTTSTVWWGSQVESGWLRPLAESLVQIRHRQAELIGLLDRLNDNLYATDGDEHSKSLAAETQTKANRCRHLLSDRLVELDEFDRRLHSLDTRLHSEIMASRTRPFAGVTRGFPRRARDVSRQLGKQMDLQTKGLNTQVDRDILERIEAPLNHLLLHGHWRTARRWTFFHSLAKNQNNHTVGVLLTGTGKDDASGLKTMRERNWCTIAQDRASCPVFGMPKAAKQLDAAREILPIERIGPRLVEWAR
jgi:hypothetical protein